MDRNRVREIAQSYLDKGDPKGWFEAIYTEAAGNEDSIPWANQVPNHNLVVWLDKAQANGAGQRALVVGCGLGDDAEFLASRGFDVTAFDISAKAVEWAKRRFPDSTVEYVAADLLAPPDEWRGKFDLVVEIFTLQVLPSDDLRAAARRSLAGFLAPNGRLLIIARGREPDEDRGAIPWPLTKAELSRFADEGLREETFEDFMDDEEPPVRRFRAVYRNAK